MYLSMTIRTKKNAFVEFLLRFFPTPRIAFGRYAEFFSAGLRMMEFKRFRATIVAAAGASPPFVLNRHLTDLFSSSLNCL
jgi:hypothetical protein